MRESIGIWLLIFGLFVSLEASASIAASSTVSSTYAKGRKSNTHQVNLMLRQKMNQLRKDVKSGKVTQEQAKVLFEKFKNIRRQELEYFHQNGQRDLTASQQAQLEQSLN
jgi:hypothetical protein